MKVLFKVDELCIARWNILPHFSTGIRNHWERKALGKTKSPDTKRNMPKLNLFCSVIWVCLEMWAGNRRVCQRQERGGKSAWTLTVMRLIWALYVSQIPKRQLLGNGYKWRWGAESKQQEGKTRDWQITNSSRVWRMKWAKQDKETGSCRVVKVRVWGRVNKERKQKFTIR